MNCMKCGRDVEEGQVFCDSCLESMGQPLKINTPVLIPTQPPRKVTFRRPVLNPEEEVKRLQKVNQNLILALSLSVMAALLFGLAAFHNEVWDVMEELGRNYHVVETVTMP